MMEIYIAPFCIMILFKFHPPRRGGDKLFY